MPWIKVRIRAPGGAEVETSAVANSGFMWRTRSSNGAVHLIPAINIPAPLARRLGLLTRVGEEASMPLEVAGHVRVPAIRLGYLDVKLAIQDREMPWVRALAICIRGESRVLLGEGLLERLKVLPFGDRWLILGETEFRDEAEPQLWHEGHRE